MKDLKQKLIIQQVDEKLRVFTPLLQTPPPPQGWIHTIRLAFNMSLRQFGDRLGLSINSAKHIEKREQEKSITLKSLEKAGEALNMKLVYGFVPTDGSIQNSIHNRANELATEMVMMTSNSMALEDQKVSDEGLAENIKDVTQSLVNEMPRYLWNKK